MPVVAVTSAWSGPVSAGTVSAGTCLTVTGAWSGPVSAGTVGRCLSSLLPVRGLDLSQLVLSAGVCRRCYRCAVWTCLSWYCLSWDLSHCYRCEVWTCLSWYCRQVSVVAVTGARSGPVSAGTVSAGTCLTVTSAWSGPVSAGTVGRCLSSLLPVRGLDLSQLVLSAGVCRRCYRCEVWTCLSWYCLSWDLSHCYQCVVWTCLSWYCRQVSVVAVTSAWSGPVSAGTVSAGTCLTVTSAWSGPVSAGTVGRCLSSLLPVRGLDLSQLVLSQLGPVSLLPVRGLNLSQLVLSAGVCRRCYRCEVWTCLSW